MPAEYHRPPLSDLRKKPGRRHVVEPLAHGGVAHRLQVQRKLPMEGARAPSLGYVARATLVVLGLWGLANVFWLGRDLFFIAFLAILFASFLSGLMWPLTRLGLPRVLAAPLALLGWLGALALLVVLAVPVLEDQVRILQRELPRGIDQLLAWLDRTMAIVSTLFGAPGDGLADRFEEELAQFAGRLVTGALPILGSLVGALASLIVILFGGLYLSIESRLFVRGTLALVPVSARRRVAETLRLVGRNLQRWIMGTVIAMILVALLSGMGLALLGIPTAFALAVLAGLLEFVPVFGPILAAVPAIAVALIVSPLTALWVLLLYIGVQQVESNLISPLVMKGVVKLPPALSLLFQVLMAILFGFIGLLVAVPLLAAIVVLVRRLYVEPLESRGRAPTSPDPAPPSA